MSRPKLFARFVDVILRPRLYNLKNPIAKLTAKKIESQANTCSNTMRCSRTQAGDSLASWVYDKVCMATEHKLTFFEALEAFALQGNLHKNHKF